MASSVAVDLARLLLEAALAIKAEEGRAEGEAACNPCAVAQEPEGHDRGSADGRRDEACEMPGISRSALRSLMAREHIKEEDGGG